MYKPKHYVPNAHPCQICNDVSTNGCRMTSDTKNSLDLWPGELKMEIQCKNREKNSHNHVITHGFSTDII